MSASVYTFLHLLTGFLLTALTFAACAAPDPAKKRPMLIATGVLSLLMLTGGFGLLARLYGGEFPTWVWIKIVCWLGLSAIAGIAYRRPAAAGKLAWLAALLVTVAIASVTLLKDTLG